MRSNRASKTGIQLKMFRKQLTKQFRGLSIIHTVEQCEGSNFSSGSHRIHFICWSINIVHLFSMDSTWTRLNFAHIYWIKILYMQLKAKNWYHLFKLTLTILFHLKQGSSWTTSLACYHCNIRFDPISAKKLETKGHWPLDDLWSQVCWGHMCDSTQWSL